MFDCNLVNTPIESEIKLSKFEDGEKKNPNLFKSLMGSLRYLTYTMPNVLHAVRVVSRLTNTPTFTHMKVSKRNSLI